MLVVRNSSDVVSYGINDSSRAGRNTVWISSALVRHIVLVRVVVLVLERVCWYYATSFNTRSCMLRFTLP